MRNKNRKFVLSFLLTVFMIASIAGSAMAAVTINPTSNEFVLNYGDTWDEDVTVTIPEDRGIGKLDVYILADTTGSMFWAINDVKSKIVDIVSTDYSGADVAFGAGAYRDIGDAYIFQNTQSITADDAAVVGAVNTWGADGGGDWEESQLYAYEQIANGDVGWRTDAKKVLVIFGDAPGHDPTYMGVTETSATAALVNAGIVFIAIDVDQLNYYGQAERIADATGGVYLGSVSSGEVADAIKDQIEAATKTINSLTLEPSDEIAGFVSSVTPNNYGPLSLDVEQAATFHVDWLGNVEGTDVEQVFNGTLDVKADGSTLISKTVKITVERGIVDVSIDVKPGSFPSSINIANKGKVPVAVFGSSDFDVSSIDPSTVVFAGAPALTIGGGLEDLNLDGYNDIVFHFDTQSLELVFGDEFATLTGQTFDGIDFEGIGDVNIIAK